MTREEMSLAFRYSVDLANTKGNAKRIRRNQIKRALKFMARWELRHLFRASLRLAA